MEIGEVGVDEFEALVATALDGIPDALSALMDNVVVLVEDEPDEPGLLGLYVGVPLTERDSAYTFAPPDRITLYRGPLTRRSRDTDELVAQVRITVVHEVAHHFGLDDARLHELGYG